MAEVHSWHNHPDPRAVVLQAVEALGAGRLVALPTDVGYVLAADARSPEAIRHLDSQGAPLTLAVGGPAHAVEVLPGLPPLARRLARRCWPGPVTLLHPDLSPNAPAELLAARQAGDLHVRSPAHSAILHVMHHLGSPLLLACPPALPAPDRQEDIVPALAALGEDVALAVEDGP